MEGTAQREITSLLQAAGRGDATALDRLLPHVYADLHRRAGGYLQRESVGHTLQTTALVHEAYLRLVDMESVEWADRVHFFSVAARCMRRILLDHARRKHAQKRGGQGRAQTLEDVAAPSTDPTEIFALDEALERLTQKDERKARVAELRLFSGLEHADIADVLGTSLSTVEREWRLARAWLHREVTGE